MRILFGVGKAVVQHMRRAPAAKHHQMRRRQQVADQDIQPATTRERTVRTHMDHNMGQVVQIAGEQEGQEREHESGLWQNNDPARGTLARILAFRRELSAVSSWRCSRPDNSECLVHYRAFFLQ